MIHIDNEQTEVTDSVEGITEAEVPQQAEPEVTPQAEPAAPSGEDSFFDPNSVPEELKGAYKQMQGAWTKKTQELAAQRKELEAYRSDAENYRKVQQYIPLIEGMQSRQQPEKSPELQQLRQMYKAEGYSDEAIDMMEKGLGFVLNHFNQTQSQFMESSRIQNQIQEATKVDPRLTDPSLVYQTEDGEQITYGQMVEQLVEADPQWQKDVPAATRRAIKKIDALIGKAKTDGKQELTTQTKVRAQKFPSTQSSPQSTSDTAVKGSIREIGKQVMAEMGMK